MGAEFVYGPSSLAAGLLVVHWQQAMVFYPGISDSLAYRPRKSWRVCRGLILTPTFFRACAGDKRMLPVF